MDVSYDPSPNDNMSSSLDTAGAITTATSIGSVIASETVLHYHPLQLWAWGIAIASGVVAICLGAVRIYTTVKRIQADE